MSMFYKTRPAWMDQAAPSGYMAGAGRGATGFTTRSDLGPARAASDVPDKADTANARWKTNETQDAQAKEKEKEKEEGEKTYDEWGGYSDKLFKNDPYEQDDEEADMIWEAIDSKMDERRHDRREAIEREEMRQYFKERPKIQQQFSDLKRNLDQMSKDDWLNLPDAADHRRVKRKPAFERFSAAPDSLLEQARAESQSFTTLDSRQQTSGFETPAASGLATPAGTASVIGGGKQDLTQLGSVRKTIMAQKIREASDSVSGLSTINPKGYLTDLNSIKITSDADISDIKRARVLYKSLTTTNPKNGPGWIAWARLEERAGKLSDARKIVTKGTEQAADSVDVWLEAARLHNPEHAKVLLARAVSRLPQSIELWMRAKSLETDVRAQRRVLRRALEFVPKSVRLWKAAIELEGPEDARILLSRAVECVPEEVDLWLALARLETYDNARVVLNKARETVPTDRRIWVSAAQLEEANWLNSTAEEAEAEGAGADATAVSSTAERTPPPEIVERIRFIIEKGVTSLDSYGVIIRRGEWLAEAEAAERAGVLATCAAIVSATISQGVDDEDRKTTWISDAETCVRRGSIHTARSIFAVATAVFKGRKSIWMRAAQLEKAHGTSEKLLSILETAIKYCPQAEVLWLMAAKEKWLSVGVGAAREQLEVAFKSNTNSEAIWLASAKLEVETNELERARMILNKARQYSGTYRIWKRSAEVEREQRNCAEEIKLLTEATSKFPDKGKLWIMLADAQLRNGSVELSQQTFKRGLRQCPTHIELWLSMARVDEKTSSALARATLDKARLRIPRTERIWLESVRLEVRAGDTRKAGAQLATALQECPKSGILHAEAIEMEPRPKQKTKSLTALEACSDDAVVILMVAKRIFWAERAIEKAKQWFERAVTLDASLGDAWATYYKFAVKHLSKEAQDSIVERAIAADPKKGELWKRVKGEQLAVNTPVEALLKLVAAKVEAV
eukprot:TRINITY_DN16643_c0_g1_i1.p1 TRINITY_DN16643_c0_g1~~TRINITY_DN16643_c0_g1_i1.p1  ORF type:complete len:968 (+),score=270.69 TRINITY_DN16643_c0_g1_i1:136-3039(+)